MIWYAEWSETGKFLKLNYEKYQNVKEIKCQVKQSKKLWKNEKGLIIFNFGASKPGVRRPGPGPHWIHTCLLSPESHKTPCPLTTKHLNPTIHSQDHLVTYHLIDNEPASFFFLFLWIRKATQFQQQSMSESSTDQRKTSCKCCKRRARWI